MAAVGTKSVMDTAITMRHGLNRFIGCPLSLNVILTHFDDLSSRGGHVGGEEDPPASGIKKSPVITYT
jgi:hypothetical protein